MTVKVLGPLDTGAERLSPREKAMFAALVLRQGIAMPPGELAEAYWGEDVPQTWGQQVKTSIARIRTRLGKQSITTRGSEYALGIDPDVIDAVRFERLVSTARQHALHGEHDRAVDSYGRGLALWRGSPYPELAGWQPGVVEALRLDEIRRSAEEELVEARLSGGEHRAVVADAERLVREQPLREDRWAILALANYQTGRQAEALATLRSARERLLDELGVEPGVRLTALETAILHQDPSLLPTTSAFATSLECPYRGLSAYGPEDADAFFGRETEIEEVLARTIRGSAVTVAGPSGSGKSSLVLAGVVPRLRDRGRTVEIIRPGAASLAAMRWIVNPDSAVDVVVLDQAEELVQGDPRESAEFCSAAAAFLERGTLILTVRSDFLDRIAELPMVGTAVGRGVLLLGALSPPALRDAIVEPARRAGLRLEPGLIELVLRDAGGRTSILPALSHALQETWVRREGATLTVDGYEASGGIAGAVAQSAEDLFQSLGQHDRELCRSTMVRLIERGDDGSSVRRRVTAGPLLLDADRRRVIDLLVGARLVTIDGDVIMVAHEAVATAWPRLDGWLEEDAAGARISRTIENAAAAWDAGGRSDDDLLRGARLEAALELREASAIDLTSVETELLDRSADRERDELRALWARAARDRRQNRRLRSALGGAAALLVVALASGGIAAVRGQDAADAAQNSLIEAITAKSTSLRQSNREMAALMAVEGYRRWPTDPRTRAALMASMTAAGAMVGVTYLEKGAWRSGIYPIPGTNQVVVARDTVARINDLGSGRIVRTLSTSLTPSDADARPWVRVSDDGSTALIVQHFRDGGLDNRELVYFFDIPSGRQIGEAVDVPELSRTVSLSADGRHASWATVGTLVVVDRDTGVVRQTNAFTPSALPDNDDASAVSAFTPSGELVVANLDGRVWMVDPVTLTQIARWTVPPGYANRGMTVTADGTVYSGGRYGTMATTSDGAMLWQHPFDRPRECTHFAASSASGVAACGDDDGIFQARDLRTGEIVLAATSYQIGGSGDLALVDKGRELLLLSATAPAVGKARVDGAGPASRVLAAGMTIDGGFDSTARRLLVQSPIALQLHPRDQRSFAVWDVASDTARFRIPEDVADPFEGTLRDARWITDDVILTWQQTWKNAAQTDPDVVAKVVDLKTGRFMSTGIPPDTTEVYPSTVPGQIIVTAGPEGQLISIDTTTLKPVGAAYGFPQNLLSVSDLAHGGRLVETTWDDNAQANDTSIVDKSTGTVIAHGLPTYGSTVGLPDGDFIAADPASLERFTGTTLAPVRRLPVSVSWTWSLQLSADGSTLLAAGEGQRAYALVDLAANLQLGDTIPEQNQDGSVALAADASAFAIPGRDGVLLWTLDPKAQTTAACMLAGREPTADEWTTYFGGLGPQTPICDVAHS